MSRSCSLCSAILVLTIATQAKAQGPWRQVAQVAGVRVVLDTSRVVWRPDSTAVVWLWWEGYAGGTADQVEHDQINCNTHQLRGLSAQTRFRDDQSTSPVRADTTWHSYLPGGLGATVLDGLCAQLEVQRSRLRPGA